jgi:hypothetical protein
MVNSPNQRRNNIVADLIYTYPIHIKYRVSINRNKHIH